MCFLMEELVFASAHVFSICHVFLSERSQAPFLFSTVSDFVCTRQVQIFQSLSAILSLRSPRHANLIFCSEPQVLGRSGFTPKGAL
jgi:hypothetical protein